ncbi:pectin methylesterase [Paenibacillus pectinilyticus]|uniref:Pectin methylesterase n=1 Tax=Paenibacillus pectinilyticus TaxID=512399 RepID=A0A1C1A8I3_9BACL|nr:pectin methylesterase [Paenibacillus pectinilyticus]
MTVAADGTGDFLRVQEAIDSVPEGRMKPITILIKSGTYKEKIYIDNPWIRLVGDGAETTVITYDDYANKLFPNGEPYHTFHSYTAYIGGDHITVEGITFENSAGKGEVVGQALAAYVDGDCVVFRGCRFLGHQDTLFTGPLPPEPRDRASFGGPRDDVPRRAVRQYYERCYLEGDIDFIFGSATAVFQDCEIRSLGRGWVTAASTPEDVPFGYVFRGCKLTGEAPEQSVGLGRPWRNYAKTAFLDCWLGPHIKAEGWDRWNEQEPIDEVRYSEVGNVGPGAVSGERIAWATSLSTVDAARWTARYVLAGEDGWDPTNA